MYAQAGSLKIHAILSSAAMSTNPYEVNAKMITLNLPELINFYDRQVQGSQGHATSLNALLGEDMAIAAFRHYLTNLQEPAVLEKIDRSCTKVGGGARLDAWLAVRWHSGETEIFQTEIKNWSSHSYRGRKTPSKETEANMTEHRKNRWFNQYDADEKVLKDKDAKKVVLVMNQSPEMPTEKPSALIIFWDPMHKDGSTEPFFRAPVKSESFTKLAVFSISNHFRNLISQGIYKLQVELGDAEQRLAWIRRLVVDF